MSFDKNSENAMFGKIVEKLDRIETQVIKTNGRVSSLEKWRYLITGALFVIITLIGWYVTWIPKK